MKIATGGFGESTNAYSWSMAWFKGKLYVGTSRNNLCNGTFVYRDAWARRVSGCPARYADLLNLDMRAEIWAYTPGTGTWQMVYRSPMVNDTVARHVVRVARDGGYRSMAVYTDRHGVTALYVGTTGFGDLAYLLRTVDGVHFTTLAPRGLHALATSIRALTPYAGRLFIAPISGNSNLVLGADRDKVLMSDDPASGRWAVASGTGVGDPSSTQLYTMAAFDGQLYAGISSRFGYEVWRSPALGTPPYRWTAVLVNGAYRGATNATVTSMAVFHDKLYVGSASPTISAKGKRAPGCELVAINPDGSWDLVVGDARQTPEGDKRPLSGLHAGFGNPFNAYLWHLATHDGWLYAGTYDYSTFLMQTHPALAQRFAGFDLWRSHDGVHWESVDTTGLGNPYNYGVRSMEDTPAGLFLGTANPFADASNGHGGTEVWELPSPAGLLRPHGVALSGSACPMAHCSPRIDGTENITIPTHGAVARWQFRQPGVGFSLSLGCSAGAHIIVCAGTNLRSHDALDKFPYVHALDFQGHLLWDSRRILNAVVQTSVPLLDNQDNSYTSDNRSIVSFSPEGVVRWQTPNPTNAPLVSLNMLQSGFLVGQGGTNGPLVVLNPQTGAIVSSLTLTGTVGGMTGEWVTANTMSVVANRLYTVTEFHPSNKYASDPLHHGRLYAVDVDPDGRMHVVWSWSFEGPTGGSPLAVPGPHTVIYDDGTGRRAGDPQHVMLFAVQDMGDHAALMWANDLTQAFGIPYPANTNLPGIQVAPAHDPRGGVWIWSRLDARVFRFDETTGRAIVSLSIPQLIGDPGATPNATIDIATNGVMPVMFTGVSGGPHHDNKIIAVDLTTGRLLWGKSVGTGETQGLYGQFPLVSTPDGATLLVVPTFDGRIRAYQLY